MKIRYTAKWFGKEREIDIPINKDGYPPKKPWLELAKALKDGCWRVRATDDKERYDGPSLP
uniref:Uncharacterized protein n=1 Tax=viral metagenome TaxID=1070528 RepID=A0A6H2A359_9ZZZZ